jgi:hypothetical protein
VIEAAACRPVSWLRLERYALGELGSDERAEIVAHLVDCARCRACADQIERDARELPPLPAAVAGVPRRASVPAPAPKRRFGWLGGGGVLTLATAAAVFAFAVLRPRDEPRLEARRIAVKGGEVTIDLVRERNGSTAWEPTSFATGDRFKLLLTCPPPLHLHADLVVLQADGPAFPGPPISIACGNRVPVLPAFRITGPGAATVCVALDPDGPPSRARLAGGDPAATSPHACLHLDRSD